MIRDEELIRDKLNFYKEKGFAVHVVLYASYMRIEAPFRNGKILEIREDSFVLDDEKLGEIIIYLREVSNVDKREERR